MLGAVYRIFFSGDTPYKELPSYAKRDCHLLSRAIESDRFHSAEAYSSLTVVSALVFGFAASIISDLSLEELEEQHVALVTCELAGMAFVACSAALSLFSLVVLCLQYYHIKVLVERYPSTVPGFISQTFHVRRAAWGSLWFSLDFFMLSLAVRLLSQALSLLVVCVPQALLDEEAEVECEPIGAQKKLKATILIFESGLFVGVLVLVTAVRRELQSRFIRAKYRGDNIIFGSGSEEGEEKKKAIEGGEHEDSGTLGRRATTRKRRKSE